MWGKPEPSPTYWTLLRTTISINFTHNVMLSSMSSYTCMLSIISLWFSLFYQLSKLLTIWRLSLTSIIKGCWDSVGGRHNPEHVHKINVNDIIIIRIVPICGQRLWLPRTVAIVRFNLIHATSIIYLTKVHTLFEFAIINDCSYVHYRSMYAKARVWGILRPPTLITSA